MEYCNICEREVDAPNEHIKSKEHRDNLEKIRSAFKDKVYEDDSIGLNP